MPCPFSALLVDLTAKRYGDLLNEHIGLSGRPYTLSQVGPLSLQVAIREDYTSDQKDGYTAICQEVAICCYGVVLSKSLDWNLYIPYNWSTDSKEWEESILALRKSLTSTVADASARVTVSIGQLTDRLNSARELMMDGKQPHHTSTVCW